jgi:hypothetical protein
MIGSMRHSNGNRGNGLSMFAGDSGAATERIARDLPGWCRH